MKYLIIFISLISCATKIETKTLVAKNLPGYYQPANGSEFNYMEIHCNGKFLFKTYDHEDKGAFIAQVNAQSFETSPQLIGHHYEVYQWPNQENNEIIKLRYVVNSMLNNYSGSLNRIESENSKAIYTFQKTKKYNCQ